MSTSQYLPENEPLWFNPILRNRFRKGIISPTDIIFTHDEFCDNPKYLMYLKSGQITFDYQKVANCNWFGNHKQVVWTVTMYKAVLKVSLPPILPGQVEINANMCSDENVIYVSKLYNKTV